MQSCVSKHSFFCYLLERGDFVQCGLCNGEISRFSAKKTKDGVLCRECAERLPKAVTGSLSSYTLAGLQTIEEYMKHLRKDLFTPTASFGCLHIDEIHGLFAVEERLSDDVKDLTDIFYCLNLKEAGLVPANVSTDRRGNVFCDFELHCCFEYPQCSFKVSVRKKVKCPSHRKNKSEISYEMPGDYCIFVKMFDLMIESARKKYEYSSQEHFMSFSKFQLFKAKTLFMLPDGYNLDDVIRQKEILIKAFQNQKTYMDIIQEAYFILTDSIGGNNT